MNNPTSPALLNDYLAYAIVLDLEEAWKTTCPTRCFRRLHRRVSV